MPPLSVPPLDVVPNKLPVASAIKLPDGLAPLLKLKPNSVIGAEA